MRIPRWLRWRTERELEEEIQTHLEMEVQANLERGLSGEQARAAALWRFGNRASLKETVREAEPFFAITSFGRDLLYGIRSLRRSPGFALAATVSLALGIGANTLIFSILNSTLLQPLAFPDPHRLAAIWTTPAQNPEERGTSSLSTYFGLRDHNRSFESIGAFNGAACGVRSLGADQNGAPAERIRGQCVSPSLFQTLGVKPILGRTFTEAEDQVDYVAPVVVLSYGLWQRRFAGDAAILGRRLLLNRASVTVIGVMPPEFNYFGDDGAFFAPLEQNRTQAQSRLGGLTMIGRLKPGTSIAQAQSDVETVAAQMSASDPERHAGLNVRLEPLQRAAARYVAGQGSEAASRDYRAPLLILQGAVGFVLLIACANVAGLFVARMASRRNEVALRLSLGAARGRIFCQLLTESLPLAMLGGLFGILLAWGGLSLFLAEAPRSFPRLAQVSVDLRVLAFTILITLATSLLFTCVQAMQAFHVNLAGPLKESGRNATGGAGRRKLRGALVASQVALAVVLLIGAGLMIRSFVRAIGNDLGADPKNLLVFDFRLPYFQVVKPHGRYRGQGLWEVSPAPAQAFERVAERLATVPGVLSVAAVDLPPFSGGNVAMPFFIEGRPTPAARTMPGNVPGEAQQTANYFAVTPEYFSTLKIPFLRGRDFNSHDTAPASLVMIVNQSMARRFFPNEDPVGKRITLDFVPNEQPREIIGVVGDTASTPLQSGPEPAFYVPQLQQTSLFTGFVSYIRTGMYFVLRTSQSPMAMLPAVKAAVAEVDRDTPVADAQTIEQTLKGQVRDLRLYMLLLVAFGLVAAMLAATGIYAVVGYTVAERRREIGIRMALGARSWDVLLMVFRDGMRAIGIGCGVGLGTAVALSGAMHSLLFGIAPTDGITYAIVVLLLLAIAGIACYLPARRAAGIDPTVALKYE